MSELIGASQEAGLDVQSGTERPLSDQERATIQRLLSDPFSFPIQFKTWLISFLEGSDLVLPRSSVQGLSTLLGTGGGAGIFGMLPAGIIFPYAGGAAPTGSLLCDGAVYDVAGKYKRLFDAIGYAYGGSGGSFNVPDLRRRVIWGAGTGVSPGQDEGQDLDVNRNIDHHHYFGQTSYGDGAHNHGASASGVGDHSHYLTSPGNGAMISNFSTVGLGSGGSARYFAQSVAEQTAGAGGHTHGISVDPVGDHQHFVEGDTGGGGEENHPAYLVCGHIINY